MNSRKRQAHLEDGVRTIVPTGRDGLFHHFDRSVRDSCRLLGLSDGTRGNDETADEVAARQSNKIAVDSKDVC